jgi:hypothetical protein
MKKIVVLPFLTLSLFASGDYIPVSELSHSKKEEYNFVNKTNINKQNSQVETNNYKSVSQESDEVIEPLEEVEIKETKPNIIENIKEKKEVIQNTKTVNKTFVKEYKKENILKDEVKYSDNSFSKDFSLTPKLTYSYLKTDISATERINAKDKESVLIPEITVSYKNHNLKAEGFETKSYFDQVLISGSDLETTVNWYKLYYMYSINKVNFGIAYNKFNLDWKNINSNSTYSDKEEFMSLELNMKNSNDVLQVEYGVSYGKNNNISYSFEYYLNLGYKLLKNDSLILSAGYRNRTIENDFIENDKEYKAEFEGPTISLTGTF